MRKWIEITDDPATLPEVGEEVIVRMNADSGGGEELEFRYASYSKARQWEVPQWCYCKTANWCIFRKCIRPVSQEVGKTPTHWRSIP